MDDKEGEALTSDMDMTQNQEEWINLHLCKVSMMIYVKIIIQDGSETTKSPSRSETVIVKLTALHIAISG